MVDRGKVRLCRAGSFCQFLTPCPLSAAHRVRTESGKEAKTKGNIMTQIYLQQAAAPTPKSIEAVLKQVSCREIRKHIKTQYSREFAYSANKQAALDSAQFRADSFNGSYAKASGEV